MTNICSIVALLIVPDKNHEKAAVPAKPSKIFSSALDAVWLELATSGRKQRDGKKRKLAVHKMKGIHILIFGNE